MILIAACLHDFSPNRVWISEKQESDSASIFHYETLGAIIPSLNNFLLNIYYVPGALPGTSQCESEQKRYSSSSCEA